MANLDLQLEAMAFVNRNKAKIFQAMSARNPRLTRDDMEDCVSEGYVIVMEMVANGMALPEIKSRFWKCVYRAGWDSCDKVLSGTNLEGNDPRIDHASLVASTAPLGARLEEEASLSSTMEAVAHNLLSPSEAKVFFLITGETRKGKCTVEESALALGADRETVKTLCRRATRKLQQARITITDGIAVAWIPAPKRIRAHHKAAARASRAAGLELRYAA